MHKIVGLGLAWLVLSLCDLLVASKSGLENVRNVTINPTMVHDYTATTISSIGAPLRVLS